MIIEIIGKAGEKGTGGARDAFAPGAHYVAGKATTCEFRNLAVNRVEDAVEDMLETSRLSDRCVKPYYHLVLSWHETEQPTDAQLVAAADTVLKEMGLADHQALLGAHRDTPRAHIHVLVNLVHPISGRAWSKTHDFQKAERAARQVELEQGWSHDRGRFDFDVTMHDGRPTAKLKLHPEEHWDRIKRDRDQGIRPKTAAQIKSEKSTGFENFEHSIPDAMKAKVAALLDAAEDWQSFHVSMSEIGLRYFRFGSGARIGIIGSAEYVKASSLGAKFSIKKLQARFGPYHAGEDVEPPTPGAAVADGKATGALTGQPAEDDQKMIKAAAFKRTLLRRVYTTIHIDDAVARQIRFVNFADRPPWVSFKDGTTVTDDGEKIRTTDDTQTARAVMVAMAQAKGWTRVRPTGSPEFVRALAHDCARAGLHVTGVPRDVQREVDQLRAAHDKQQRRLDRQVIEAQRAHLESAVDREKSLAANAREAGDHRDAAEEITAEAQAVLDALSDDKTATARGVRKIIREHRRERLGKLPDRRRRPDPQPSPDARKTDPRGKRQLQKAIRENDAMELEALKSLDIGAVAALSGWQDVSRTHRDGHGDGKGAKRRTYKRGGDTIKCTFKEGRWLWRSNKSGASGSVVDLWLRDNPGKTLGHARQALRDLVGVAQPSGSQTAGIPPDDAPKDHTGIRQKWQQAGAVTEKRTYAERRGIARATLQRFNSEVRSGVFDGVYAAHRDAAGNVVGFEQRWEKDGKKNKARFKAGGDKTLAVFGDADQATRIVVMESCLDALALAELEARTDTLYTSTGGGFGGRTIAHLATLLEGRILLNGLDNDAGGDTNTKKLLDAFPDVTRYAPPRNVPGSDRPCSDWLDVLNAVQDRDPGERPDIIKAVLAQADHGTSLETEQVVEDPFARPETAAEDTPDDPSM